MVFMLTNILTVLVLIYIMYAFGLLLYSYDSDDDLSVNGKNCTCYLWPICACHI